MTRAPGDHGGITARLAAAAAPLLLPVFLLAAASACLSSAPISGSSRPRTTTMPSSS